MDVSTERTEVPDLPAPRGPERRPAARLRGARKALVQNPNANAIRWGTLYNFRFDSNRPPQLVGATIGFFKTGAPMVIQIMGPTPAAAVSVSISGRVLSPEGQPIRNAVVTLDDQAGHTWTTTTGSLGYYGFENVATGPTYMLNPSAKRYRFTPVPITPTDNIADFNLTANPQAIGRGFQLTENGRLSGRPFQFGIWDLGLRIWERAEDRQPLPVQGAELIRPVVSVSWRCRADY